MNNILQAITHKDIDDLRSVLEMGWSPPRDMALHSGTFTVYSAWTETIVNDWVDGLMLLDEYFPNITVRREIWELILRNASIKCLRFVWDKMAEKTTLLTNPPEKERVFWIQSLMSGMGEPWSPAIDVREVLPVIDFLREKGFGLNELFPGEYETNDLRMSGHSLWTRAVSVQRWDIVDRLWPSVQSTPQPWDEWPRISEVLLHLMNMVVGDYQPIVINGGEARADTERQVLIRWLKDFGADWLTVSQSALSWPKEIQKLVRGDQSDELWARTQVPVAKALMIPTPMRMSAWLRLPLHTPSATDRQVIWNAWLNHLINDPDKSWLHQLALYPSDPDVQQLLALMRHDEVPMANLWKTPNSDGLSAAELWKELGDHPSPFA